MDDNKTMDKLVAAFQKDYPELLKTHEGDVVVYIPPIENQPEITHEFYKTSHDAYCSVREKYGQTAMFIQEIKASNMSRGGLDLIRIRSSRIRYNN